jgi:Hypothetical glycosyl hydrolase family 15
VIRRRRGQALFAFLAAASALTALSASAVTSTAPGLAALRLCGGPLPQPAAQYRYAILQASDWRRIAAIKLHNPQTVVLVYKDMASTRDDAGRSDLPTGVSYAYADKYHPEWFLKDTEGRRVNWADWPHSWQMDVGSRSYQRAWARSVAKDLRQRGWDGVFVDGISRTMQYPWFLNGRVLAKYPGPRDYERATTRFLRRVGPALRHGHLVVGNVNDAGLPLWRRWLRFMSGVSKEWWTKADAKRGSGMLTGAEWRYQMRLLSAAQARHKIFIALAYGQADDFEAMDYARASFLLFARGGRSAFSYAAPCSSEPPSSRWREGIGAPRGRATRVGEAWRRDFTGGIAVVNPSGSASVTLPLGARFVEPGGTVVTSVLLPPHTGLTLRRP